jgi:Na+/proline symporter/signal transduction histidine kinase
MTFNLTTLFLASLIYLSVLFFIAYATERGWIARRIVRHPLIYTLSLGVYATSWSYYGSIGFAETQGFLFLAIYIGPTLAFILTPLLLAPILRLIRDYQLTSLADLFAFRYSSQFAGILVTLFMLIGTLPYIALQIRAVTESMRILTHNQPPVELGLLFCITLTVFAILFGARHISPREKHEGLVVAIAFESLVKITAMLSVGLFALWGVFDGPSDLNRWLTSHPEALQALYEPVQEGPWTTLVLLSFCAAFLLPRQFHMGFVENLQRGSLSSAAWGFPLFLLVFNLAIPVILWASQVLKPTTPADYYVLGITQFSDNPLLPFIAFIGGLSAASAMVIVTTLALAQMALNHLLLPASYPDPAVDMYRWLLWGRRTLIVLLILTSYGMYVVLERSTGLVQLGLISFVAVAQFLPGLSGVLFWRRATRAGFLVGLMGGSAIWYTTLLMPLLERSGIILSQFNLMQALGVADQNPWEFVTFWSLSFNTLLFVGVSLVTHQDANERRAAAACFQDPSFLTAQGLSVPHSPRDFSAQLARTIGSTAAFNEVSKALKDLQMDWDENRLPQLQKLRDRIERNLSGMLGPILARMIVDSRLYTDAGTRSMLVDHMRFIEDRLEQSHSQLKGLMGELDQLRRYHRQILEDLPLGACSLTASRDILTWNQAMEQLSAIHRQIAMGSAITDLPAPWSKVLATFLDQNEQHLRKTRVVIRGQPRWFDLRKASIGFADYVSESDTSSFQGGTVILVEDLTELQTLEMELAHSERLASLGTLAAGVAHEIGNPVTGIACIAQNLQEENDPTNFMEGIDEILQQTQRITAIVRSLVTFSRAGPLPENQSNGLFNLRDCFTDAQRLVQLSHYAKRLQYTLDCHHDIVVEGDQQRLFQVFVNLLSNACDASPANTPIVMRAFIEKFNQVKITVTDQGSGIPKEFQERVFEPFFTTKEPGKGTGLGLPLVYTIVREHGGSITLDSQTHVGTRVTVWLPLRQQTVLDKPCPAF